MDLVAVRTQQSADPDQRSELQRSNAFGRIMSQFMSSANALTRAEYAAIVERARGQNYKHTASQVYLDIPFLSFLT